jgi:hypothetical protein
MVGRPAGRDRGADQQQDADGGRDECGEAGRGCRDMAHDTEYGKDAADDDGEPNQGSMVPSATSAVSCTSMSGSHDVTGFSAPPPGPIPVPEAIEHAQPGGVS